MGEDFQFSRPYKWRYSKLFHRLFVYCSRLLIARDNSTGFTIQWGTADTKATWIGFPRSFSSVLSVVSGQWYNSHSGDTDNILSWNNSGYTRSAIGAFKWTWVAVGFS